MRKKTLYDVLQVSRTASTEVITSAYETRMRALGDSSAPEVLAERELLRNSQAILSDPTRRKLYDEKLRDEALRTMGSGGDPNAVRPSAATHAAAAADEPSRLPWLMIAVFGALALAGTWLYLDHKRSVERLRQAEAQRVEQARLLEEEAKLRQDNAEWAKAEIEKRQQEMAMRRWEAQRQRDQAQSEHSQRQYANQLAQQERQKAMDARRSEAERQRQEQENLRRQQIQLQREQRMLRELENNRGMKF